jgi:hypothetical protein
MSVAARDLFVGDQHKGLCEHRFHTIGVGDEIRADVAAVDLHAFDVLGLKGQALALFDRDDAIAANLVHHLGDQVTDLLILPARWRPRRRSRPWW